ncbi:hypothetical protein L1987_32599 [Smallanthus sonchifolius]|uniref:Uncharacterized protein n=1 Tax=Smallanthus sonchifolius TaxID=185202 RepID=A0ACB9HPW2_9ASTR|nr:hypothetical protein L1987_32599 [Smallanthus sonchifolius]
MGLFLLYVACYDMIFGKITCQYSGRGTSIGRFSTVVALEEPITPHVKVEYTKLLINGKFVDGALGKTFRTLDPRTGQLIANVAEGDTEDVNRAMSASRKAFDEGPWPRMTAYVSLFFGSFFSKCFFAQFHSLLYVNRKDLARILLRFTDLVEQHAHEIVVLNLGTMGSRMNRDEISLFIRLFHYYAGFLFERNNCILLDKQKEITKIPHIAWERSVHWFSVSVSVLNHLLKMRCFSCIKFCSKDVKNYDGMASNEVAAGKDVGAVNMKCEKKKENADLAAARSSIAFHFEGELLAVAAGHKYNSRGETSSPAIIIRTRRSLHFHPHSSPLLLTAEEIING